MAVLQTIRVVIMRCPVGAVIHSLSLQDHILPYCCDPRHPADTWFIIAEEDFRLCEKDDRDFKSILLHQVLDNVSLSVLEKAQIGHGGEEIFVDPEVLYAQRQSLTGPSEDEPLAFLEEAGSQFKKLMGGLFTRAKPPTSGVREAPEVLTDLVKMSIAAHRANIGNFLWYSWEGALARGSRSKPCHGSTLVGISVKGARMLLDAMNSGEIAMQHADIGIRHHMEQHCDDFGCSYMYPSVGHYAVHKSGCEASIDVRDANWLAPWVQEGTRQPRLPLGGTDEAPAKQWQTRYLVRFRKKGQDVQWVRKVALPEGDQDELLIWKSWREDPSLDPSNPDAPMTSPRTVGEIRPHSSASSSAVPPDPTMTRREKRSRRVERVFDRFRNWAEREDEVR